MRAKIDLYRRLARVATDAELADFVAELHDRFGPTPGAVGTDALASERADSRPHRCGGVRSIHLEDGYAVFRYTSPQSIKELASSSREDLRIVDGRSAYLPLKGEEADPDKVLERIKSLLQPT